MRGGTGTTTGRGSGDKHILKGEKMGLVVKFTYTDQQKMCDVCLPDYAQNVNVFECSYVICTYTHIRCKPCRRRM